MPMVRRARSLATRVASGDIAGVRSDLGRVIQSEFVAVGFRHDRERSYPEPTPTEWDLVAAPLDGDIALRLFDAEGLDDRDRQFLDRRRALWEQGFRGGWVVLVGDEPAYLQFYLGSGQNDLIRSYWGPLFPWLADDTLLAEGAWVPPAFRTRGLMAHALSVTTAAAVQAAGPSIRYVICYPEEANKGAVIGSHQAGFDVVERRIETWRWGRQEVVFEPATIDDIAVLASR
ncbi:MAG: hypothetical protein AAF467_07710 [Actinomycetota bacterium]